jgi:putative hydrolase of the HAD superfamily
VSISAVLFDLDGTLHDRAESIRRYLKGHVTRFGMPAGYSERFIVLDDFGYRPKREVFPQLVAEFGLEHDHQQLLQDFDDHGWDDVAPMLYAHEVLSELRRRGVRLGVISNGWTVKQLSCLSGLGWMETFDDIIVSETVGLRKPDPAIFHLALERLGLHPDEALYVGDSPTNDIQGPQSAGIKAALFPGGHPLNATTYPDYVLTDLRDVLAIVGIAKPVA